MADAGFLPGNVSLGPNCLPLEADHTLRIYTFADQYVAEFAVGSEWVLLFSMGTLPSRRKREEQAAYHFDARTHSCWPGQMQQMGKNFGRCGHKFLRAHSKQSYWFFPATISCVVFFWLFFFIWLSCLRAHGCKYLCFGSFEGEEEWGEFVGWMGCEPDARADNEIFIAIFLSAQCFEALSQIFSSPLSD